MVSVFEFAVKAHYSTLHGESAYSLVSHAFASAWVMIKDRAAYSGVSWLAAGSDGASCEHLQSHCHPV